MTCWVLNVPTFESCIGVAVDQQRQFSIHKNKSRKAAAFVDQLVKTRFKP